MKNKKQIKKIIIKYLEDNFFYDAIKIKDHDSLTKGGYVDSIGMLSFIDFLSKEFNIEIPDSMLTPSNLDSIKSSTMLVEKLMIKNGKD